MSYKTSHIKFISALICLIAFNGLAQTKVPVKDKRHNLAFYAGFGPNRYFNNLVLIKNKVNEYNYAYFTRIMWEPEHNLSIGIESGYNRLYTVETNIIGTTTKIKIVNAAIPIQLTGTMKLYKNLYSSFTLGQSFLLNDVYVDDEKKVHSAKLALGDYGAAIGYKTCLKNRFYLGGEIKAFYSSQLEDKNITLAFFGGVRFW